MASVPLTRSATSTALAVAVALSGCGDDGTSGAATPQPRAPDEERPLIPSTPTPTPTATPSEERVADPATAELDPCELLSAAEQRSFGVEPGKPEELGYARACLWQASGRYSMAIGIFDTLGLRDVVAKGKIRRLTLGSHAAGRFTGELSTCAFAIEVSESSRVDVNTTAGSDLRRACAVAERAAGLVERKLP